MTYVELVAVDRIYPPKKLMGVPLEDWPMNQLLNYKSIQNKTLLLAKKNFSGYAHAPKVINW